MKTQTLPLYAILCVFNVCTDAFASPAIPPSGYETLARDFAKLKEDIDNRENADNAVSTFFYVDGKNPEAKGEEVALEWTRKILAIHGGMPSTVNPSARTRDTGLDILTIKGLHYLMLKGDARDIPLLNQYTNAPWGRILEMRVAGTNVIDIPKMGRFSLPWFFPSVTNTGPQALYVGEILYRYWEGVEFDTAKIPQELLTMVVSFDKDGNPVSSVDLAKFGLSMPTITPNPKKHINWDRPPDPSMWQYNTYTVTFPDLAKSVTMQLDAQRKHIDTQDYRKLYSPIPRKSPPPAE